MTIIITLQKGQTNKHNNMQAKVVNTEKNSSVNTMASVQWSNTARCRAECAHVNTTTSITYSHNESPTAALHILNLKSITILCSVSSI